MNTIDEIQRINAAELDNRSVNTSASWHVKFAQSPWVYVGNLPLQLSEGDIICVMSQWGEIDDIHLVRDRGEGGSGKSRGFGFVKYEDTRSCALAVDNFCGIKILNRSIRVDHVENYRLPKHLKTVDEHVDSVEHDSSIGHAYRGIELANNYTIYSGQNLFNVMSHGEISNERNSLIIKDRVEERKNEKDEAKLKRKELRSVKRQAKIERRKRRKMKQKRNYVAI